MLVGDRHKVSDALVQILICLCPSGVESVAPGAHTRASQVLNLSCASASGALSVHFRLLNSRGSLLAWFFGIKTGCTNYNSTHIILLEQEPIFPINLNLNFF